MYDYLIIGAGPFGCTFAQQATRHGKKVLVIDKRMHIAGNCYTELVNDIDVHKYGAHIFHTNSEYVWNYVNQFATFNRYTHRVKVAIDDAVYSFPINLVTLQQLWGVTTPEEARQALNMHMVNVKPTNFENCILSLVGEEIYNKFFRGYTTKQWMRNPKDLPAKIARRIPVRLTYDDNYFTDMYQGIPLEGYTEMFDRMLARADVQVDCDFFENKDDLLRQAKRVVYTGRIDEFYDYRFGQLDYLSLRFREEILTCDDFQGTSVINYPSSNILHTRIIEHKHFNNMGQSGTVVSYEYPEAYTVDKTPYYPVNDDKNNALYEKYASIESDVIFGGRLGTYKYYNMDQVIAQALNMYKKISQK